MSCRYSLSPAALWRACLLLSGLLSLPACVERARQIDGLDGAYFGEAVAIDGDLALIGAPGGRGDGGSLRGLAYLFGRTPDGWEQLAGLGAANPARKTAHDYFGEAVALAGNTALVGAWMADDTAPVAGAAYVFEKGPHGWRRPTVLINPDARESHLLGQSVALDGNTAVVGAPGANRRLRQDHDMPVPAWSGNVYVWTRDAGGWRYQAKLTPDAGLLSAAPPAQPHPPYYLARNFGQRLALDGDTLVVSAHEGTVGPGKVYIFRRQGADWVQEARLEQARASWGIDIAVSGDTVAVAAADSIFIYGRAGGDWPLQARLEPRADGKESGFGHGGMLSMDGDLLVAGAIRYRKRRGAAYVFRRTAAGWKQEAILTAADSRADRPFSGAVGDLFGASVAVDDGTIIVGANFNDSAGPNNGAAYLFERRQGRWVRTASLTAPVSRPPAAGGQ